jgi:hypothetical protein
MNPMTNTIWRVGGAILATLLFEQSAGAQTQASSRPSSRALDDILGVWQSDTVGGMSARTTCAHSPLGAAIVCEQRITAPDGEHRALNFFLADSASNGYLYYGLPQPGLPMTPTRLTIANHVWTYGGQMQRDSSYYRTLNDFSAGNAYVWRQEKSRDGVHWTVMREGRVMRVKPRGNRD